MEESDLNNQTNPATNGGENQPNGAENQTVSFEDLLNSNKKYRQEFDRRMNKTVETTTSNVNENWETKLSNDKTEAEKLSTMNETQKLQYQLEQEKKINEETLKKLNARDLKDEAIKIATTSDTAFDPEFLNLFKFEDMTAEDLKEKTKTLKAIQDRIVEKTINEWSKEKPPYNPDPSGSTTANEAVRKIMGLK